MESHKEIVPLPGRRSVEHAPPTRSFQYNATTARSVVSSIPKLKNSEIGQAWRRPGKWRKFLQQQKNMSDVHGVLESIFSYVYIIDFKCNVQLFKNVGPGMVWFIPHNYAFCFRPQTSMSPHQVNTQPPGFNGMLMIFLGFDSWPPLV